MCRNSLLVLGIAGLLLALPVQAQEGEEPQCTAVNGLTSGQVFEKVKAFCCGQRNDAAKKNCISGRIRSLREFQTALGQAFFTAVQGDLNALLAASCSDDVVPESDSCILSDDVAEAAEAACCDRKNQDLRQSCLTLYNGRLNRNRAAVGQPFVKEAGSKILAIRKNYCRLPKEKASLKCDVDMKVRGGSGFLHKPSGDHTSAVVVLLPKTLPSARGCGYYRADTGKKFRDFQYTGRANGNRPHWRPLGEGRCSSLNTDSKNKGMIFRCQIGSRYYCWGNSKNDAIKNACSRHE